MSATTKNRLQSLKKTLRLDKHHTIERFGVLFGAVSLALVGVLTMSGASALTNQRAVMSSQVLYTPQFTTSRTQLAGAVTGVHVSTDRSRALLMMSFEDSTGSSVSTDAANYRAFLTGSNASLQQERLKTAIQGNLIVFGSTGYIGVLLDSDEPFEQQIMNLTMRADAELVFNQDEGELREDLVGDPSFAEFDQWRLFFNPGASDAQPVKALDDPEIDPEKLFAQLVISQKEADVRAEMEAQLVRLRADLTRIGEFEADMARVNVGGVRIVAPELPAEIAGDAIVGETLEEAEGDSATLELETDWVDPRGFDFAWRDGSIQEGYLDDIVPEGESYVTYLNKRAADLDRDASEDPDRLNVNSLEWMLTNGTDLMQDYPGQDNTMKPLKDIMTNLSQAYQDYAADKREYQVTMHSRLIDLEVELRNVGTTYSVNDSETAVVILTP